MKLKQVAVVTDDLAPVRAQIFDLLGLDSDFQDPGVAEFGLHNSVMAIGDTFLEVVSPKEEGTSAARLLDRRGGNGGYMVLCLVDKIDIVGERVDNIGVRKIWETDRKEVSAFHVHPKDIGAAIVSFDEMRPADSWLWAGPSWLDRQACYVNKITCVDIQAKDPVDIASKWAACFKKTYYREGAVLSMLLDEGEVRFVEAKDGRGDGIAAVEFSVSDQKAINAAAEKHSLPWSGSELSVCGVRFRFKSEE